MGQKSKIDAYGIKDLVIEEWDGNKNTIAKVTATINEYLAAKGYPITVSREGIRRVIRSHREEIEDLKKSMEASKAMAAVLKDNPGTEASEAVLMQIFSLVSKEVRGIEELNFEDPKDIVIAATQLANAQVRMSAYRMQAIKALDNAKAKIKDELARSIHNDADLLMRLYAIIDKAEVK